MKKILAILIALSPCCPAEDILSGTSSPQDIRDPSLTYVVHRDGTSSAIFDYGNGCIQVVKPDGTRQNYQNLGFGQIHETQ
jgi:hypothetical protein